MSCFEKANDYSDVSAKDLTDKQWQDLAEQNLYEIAQGAEGFMEKLDKEGNVHMLRFKRTPDLEANKLILKNMSKGKWSDKIEISSTHVNVNLTASYDEVNRLIEQQKAESSQKIIDVIPNEVKSGDSKSN